MQDISQKKAHAQSIVISGVLLLGMILSIVMYVVPNRSLLSAEITRANTLKDRFDLLKSSGPTSADIEGFESLSALDASERKSLSPLMVKPDSESRAYDEWIASEMSRYQSSTVVAQITSRQALISGVLPVLSIGGSHTTSAGSMTLTEYVRLIEVNWLAKRGMSSTSDIGFSGLSPALLSGSVKNIVTLPLKLEVRGSSKDIYALIKTINTTGTLPDVLTGSGAQDFSQTTPFSNPLVRITSFTPKDIPTIGSSEATSATLDLLLYLRSPNISQYAEVTAALSDKSKKLSEQLSVMISREKDDVKQLALLRGMERELVSVSKDLAAPLALPQATSEKSGESLDKKISQWSRTLNSLDLRISKYSSK